MSQDISHPQNHQGQTVLDVSHLDADVHAAEQHVEPHTNVAESIPNAQLAGDDSVPANKEEITDSLTDPHAFVESAADELMQEVFGEVDRMLDKGVVIPPSAPHPSDETLSSLAVASVEPGGALAPRDSAPIDTLQRQSDGDRPEQSVPPPEKPSLTPLLWKVCLMVAASVSLGIGLAFWIAQRNQLQVATSPSTPVDASSAMSGEGQDFLSYLTKSLEAIDYRYERLARATGTPEEGGNASGAIADALNASDEEDTVERVYIPVYQPSPGTGSLPPLTAAPLNLPPVNAPTPAPAETGEPTPVPNIASSTTYTLVGTLELGDRSAAIFEYAGSAHRIEIGEQIGASGWNLVSVSGQEAIIRRNGDVRSIYMEQSF